MIKNLLTNWKTTSAGVAMILTSLIHLAFQIKAHTVDESACTVAALAVLGGVGLIFAGDAAQSVQLPPAPPTHPTP